MLDVRHDQMVPDPMFRMMRSADGRYPASLVT